MTISDAIPIQFWVNGVETFNQKEVCGITQACFCLPFNCDDEIRIQFQDETENVFVLAVLDSSGNEITTLPFSRLSENTHEMSFVPSEIDICDEIVRLTIRSEIYHLCYDYNVDKDEQAFTARTGLGDYWGISPNGLGWTQTESYSFGGFTIPNGCWFYNPTAFGGNPNFFAFNINNAFTTSELLGQSFDTISNQIIKFSVESGAYTITANGTITITIFYQLLYQGVVVSTSSQNLTASGLNINLTASFGLIENCDGVRVFATKTAGTATLWSMTFGTPTNGITLLDFYVEDYEAASSDCIDIKSSHDCTTLIRYDNSKDFADIDYSNFSPASEFYIRIPAIFFHETNTEEQERFETSGETIVRLRDEIKVKRLLEIGFMPDYMHRKLLLILAHDTIEIDGETWVRTDPYEKPPPTNRRYPLKKAQVLLTQQGYIKRNIL